MQAFFFIMDFLLATCVESLPILFQDNHFLMALKGCFCSTEYNFLPSGTLDSVILIYIYIAPFIPEDPRALLYTEAVQIDRLHKQPQDPSASL